MKHRILFITRNYPPKIGGLENYSYNLIKEFEQHHVVYKIALTRSNLNLIWFLPYSMCKGLWLTWKHSIRRIHLCDALLAPLGVLLKRFCGASISISIHGLDITYGNLFYQWLIPRCTARLDQIICVSHATRQECAQRGISTHKCEVIPNGIRPGENYLPGAAAGLRNQLAEVIGISLDDKIILVTIGRLVKRKGVAWFIEQVISHLDSNYIYLIAGDGPEYARIERRITKYGLKNRVFLLGRVSDEMRRMLYNASDIFIMPNVTVANDTEGFGIAIIEAGSSGLPVVASKIQGIRDAVVEGKTGYLVEEGNVEQFLEAIRRMNLNKDAVRTYVNNEFDWSKIYERYQSILFDQP